MVPSITQGQVDAILRAFLLSILPAGVVVLAAQQNRIPQPKADNYVLSTLLNRKRLGTTVEDWDKSPAGAPTQQSWIESTSLSMQLDFHGSDSTDNAQVFATLFRSDFAYQFMANMGLYPDYCTDGVQMPFVNGEAQYEDRWVVNAVFDANIIVLAPQEFADQVDVGLIEVDTVYPPA